MDIPLTISITLVLIAAVVIYIHRYLTSHQGYWESQGVNTVPPSVFTFPEFFTKNLHELEKERYKKYGRIYGSYDIFSRTISIAEPELVKNILVRDFHVFTNRRALSRNVAAFSSTLMAARDEQWKRIRTVVSPSFTSGKMRKMNPLFVKVTENLLNHFSGAAETEDVIDLKTLFSCYSMDVIGVTAFGIWVDALKNPSHPFVQNSRKVFQRDAPRWPAIALFLPSVLNFLVRPAMEKLGFAYFLDAAQEIIDVRSKQKERVKQVDLLQLMLDARSGSLEADEKEQCGVDNDKPLSVWNVNKTLSDMEIQAQCLVFLLAGHETTSNALSFVFYELTLNPDVQEKLFQEILETFAKHGDFNHDVVRKMEYLDAVISETLRLHTLSLRLEREVKEDYILDNTGITLPKGSVISIPVQELHHDPEFFPEPEKFLPERFLPENRSSILPYTYLPFSDGPRNCIGMRFALLEIKICIAMILHKFKFIATEETKRPLETFTSAGLYTAMKILVGVHARK